MRRQNWLWLIAFGLGLAVLLVYLNQRFPQAVGDGDHPRFVYLLLLLVLIGSSLVLTARSRPGTVLRYGAIWVAIGLVLVVGYSYRDLFADLKARVAGELLPREGQAVGQDAVMFRAGSNGHFLIEAVVDGERIEFMVDTGASDVVLTPADAERLGLAPESLDYTRIYETANGTVRGAPIELGEIVVGPIRLTGVTASVNQSRMRRSLLGMSFLGRISGYEVRGDKLTLWR